MGSVVHGVRVHNNILSDEILECRISCRFQHLTFFMALFVIHGHIICEDSQLLFVYLHE